MVLQPLNSELTIELLQVLQITFNTHTHTHKLHLRQSLAALDYFQKSIQVPLLKKILDRENVPETLPKWYKKCWKSTTTTTRFSKLSKGTDWRRRKESHNGASKKKKTKMRWMSMSLQKSTRPWRTRKEPNSWRRVCASDAPKGGTPQPRLSREEGKGHNFTIDGYHPHSDPYYPKKDDGKGTHSPHPKSHGLVKRLWKDGVLWRGRTGGFLIRRTRSTSVSPSLNIHAVTTHITANTISLPIEIKKNEYESVKTLALIDSRAGGIFIYRKYVEQLGLPIQTLKRPIMVRNVDGT